MKVNFSKIKLLDLEGKVIPKAILHKTLAGVIYQYTKNLDLVEVARKINKGEEVELRDSEVTEIRRIIQTPEAGMFAFARKAINDFLEEAGKECKKGQKKQ